MGNAPDALPVPPSSFFSPPSCIFLHPSSLLDLPSSIFHPPSTADARPNPAKSDDSVATSVLRPTSSLFFPPSSVLFSAHAPPQAYCLACPQPRPKCREHPRSPPCCLFHGNGRKLLVPKKVATSGFRRELAVVPALLLSPALLFIAIAVGCGDARPTASLPSETQVQQVQSSALESIGYDEGSRTLVITFKNGSTYEYSGVPRDVYGGLMAASSKGTYFNSHIKGMYPYRLMSSGPAVSTHRPRREPRATRPLRQPRPSRPLRSTRQHR